uniref:Major sperm protein n=1 Tax=Plectus sambesii TaxID=2011161 RepID=A0A914VQV8_9BILA
MNEEMAAHATMPDAELRPSPRWLIFSADSGYERPQVMRVQLSNTDNQRPVVFHVRAKDPRVPRVHPKAGWIEPGGAVDVDVFVPAADDWPRDPVSFAGQRHRVLVESAHPPLLVDRPSDPRVAADYAKELFRSARAVSTMYTFLSLWLPKLIDSSAADCC